MGRTNPTYRDLLSAIEERWGSFRRVLRRRDRPRFDRLFEHARAHADAASNLNHEEPLFPLVAAVLVEQERRLDEQAERIDRLAARLDAEESGFDAEEADDDAV